LGLERKSKGHLKIEGFAAQRRINNNSNQRDSPWYPLTWARREREREREDFVVDTFSLLLARGGRERERGAG